MLRFALIALAILAAPATAKDSVGVFDGWAAFRDPSVPRCYAIAVPQEIDPGTAFAPYATVGTWPQKGVRGQIHFRLSRPARIGSVALVIGSKRFPLSGGGANAWAADRRMDAAIVAAMRSAEEMTLRGTSKNGRRFSDTYRLAGAASAMDAATVACTRR